MNKSIFTLPALIALSTLSAEMAAFLYFCLRRRVNITVVGETDSGKTTLINALDLLAPKHLRKIYVEEQVESLPQDEWDLHQVKYVVDPEDPNTERTKSDEIRRLLHRSPDLVYLGELLDEDETKAFFHCLSAGLRGLQTTHARDVDSILNRWLIHFNIPPVLLNDLGIILSMRKTSWGRILTEVSEVSYEPGPLGYSLTRLFTYVTENSDWDRGRAVTDSITYQKILKNEPLKSSEMEAELMLYENLFKSWSKRSELAIADQINLLEFVDSRLNMVTPKTSPLERQNIWTAVEDAILNNSLEANL